MHKPLYFSIHWLFILAALLLVACSTPVTPQPTSTPEAQAITAAPQEGYPGISVGDYPAPLEALGYPNPSDAQSQAPEGRVYPTITVMPELGQVEGVILRNGQPVVNVIMYVSEVIKDSEGTNVSVKFDRTSPLNAPTDNDGRFVIPNIPPGDYGLVLDAIVNTLFLSNPQSNEQIVLTVENGAHIDLGALDFDELPIP